MALNLSFRCRGIQQIVRVLPHSFPGFLYQARGSDGRFPAAHSAPMYFTKEKISMPFAEKMLHAWRFSTVAEISQDPAPESDLMSFIEATLDQVKGPHHFWLNRAEESNNYFNKDGIFFVVFGTSVEDLQKAKFLQQRFPWIQVFAFQPDSTFLDAKSCGSLIHLIMKEYINFPILLSGKTFPEVMKEPCYILFKGFENPQLFHGRDLDLGLLQSAIKSLHDQPGAESSNSEKLKSSWSKQSDLSDEPYICSSLRNLLLYFPACLSSDESGGRLFLSDGNHHRIIIFDGHGKILDMIGSSPGFEDGEFDNARISRPAGSYYHASEDSLYFVDSENHAIRRADLDKRVVETVYPVCKVEEKGGIWTWMMNKLGMEREVKIKSDEFDPEALMFPWHLLKSEDDDNFLIMNKRCDTLWIMDSDKLTISEVIKGSQEILETYGHIMEKVSSFESMSQSQVHHPVRYLPASDSVQHRDLLVSSTSFGDSKLVCDQVGHRVLHFDTNSDVVSSLQFSNFGILGLPYWLLHSLERAYTSDVYLVSHPDHVQSFSLLPGKIDIELNVDIPANTELVEPLQEGCVWRQARGSAVEMSGLQSIGAPPEKVGASQQFYDDLDNLVFSDDEDVSPEEKANPYEDLNDNKIHIDCCVNASPGLSEVIVYAALYLKLKKGLYSCEENPAKKAAAIADILKLERYGAMKWDAFVDLLTSSNEDLDDLIFTKILHVRVRLNMLDSPKADKSMSTKSIVLTDSKIEVKVSL